MIRIVLLITLISLSILSIGQERQSETRKKPTIVMTGFSEKIEHVPGWAKYEYSQGDIKSEWKQSDVDSQYSTIPVKILEEADYGFEYMQMYQFTFNGLPFHFMLIKYKNNLRKVYIIRNSSLDNFKEIVNNADGQVYQSVDILAAVEFYGFLEFDEIINDKPILKSLIADKPIQRYSVSDPTKFSYNSCGSKLFTVTSQVINNQKLIRFLILHSKNAGDERVPFTTSVITHSYFELDKGDFEKLYTFSNDWERYNKQIDKEKIQYQQEQDLIKIKEDQRVEQIVSFYQQKADSINQNTFITKQFIHKYSVFESSEEDARIVGTNYSKLLNQGEFGVFDVSSINDGQVYSTVVGIDSTIVNPTIMKELLGELRFKPASFTFDYFDYSHADRDHRWCQFESCVTLDINEETPVKFCQKYENNKPAIGQNIIIFKLKKTKEGVQVLNTFTTDSTLLNEIRPQINFELELAKHSRQTWYLYYIQEFSIWSIYFGTNQHYYKDEDLVKFTGKGKEWKKIELYNPSTANKYCP